ncbi:hypothetical protein [Deinococcus roseus]|uniref:Uncharacterized protein n=1 Tax=Deinococcus roseus TaxID=392414 RepID=A0ABQ2CVH5_9DEIO|nr:hypothetical protein [Deinococcus roseus]GGJ21239.1 hypothetical protein GCM10008938_04310 [Deinococcus roseus]
MKLLLLTALGVGLAFLGKKWLGNRMPRPLQALPSSAREHSEDQVDALISPAGIH